MRSTLPRVLAMSAACSLFTLWASRAGAAIFVINNLDGAGEGLNDTTAVQPVGGNSATTLGGQRLAVLQAAANIWGGLLDSGTAIRIDATFDPLACTTDSAVLGAAGPQGAAKDFAGATLPNRWHNSALANSLAGHDLDPARSEILAQFNSSVGGANCLTGAGFYLGLDGNRGQLTDLMTIVLHELAHGLGFSTFVDLSTGAELSGAPDAFEGHLLDLSTGKRWDVMTDAERLLSAQHTRNVAWDGAVVTAAVPQKLAAGTPVLIVTTPPEAAGEHVMSTASFGPDLSQHPAAGSLRLARDSGGTSLTDACDPPLSGVSGGVALIDRGTCAFSVKAKNAQNAGAIAVLIADNVAESPPMAPGGADPTITIPTVGVTMSDGTTFKSLLASGKTVTLSLAFDAARPLGADAQHRGLIYTPSPQVAGSSVTHWDPMATPNLLMEPVITPDQNHGVDLTLPLLQDTGWRSLAVAGVPALPLGGLLLLGCALVAGVFATAVRPARARGAISVRSE